MDNSIAFLSLQIKLLTLYISLSLLLHSYCPFIYICFLNFKLPISQSFPAPTFVIHKLCYFLCYVQKMCVSLLFSSELHQSFVQLVATAPEETSEARPAAVATMQVHNKRGYILSSIFMLVLVFHFRKMHNVALQSTVACVPSLWPHIQPRLQSVSTAPSLSHNLPCFKCVG